MRRALVKLFEINLKLGTREFVQPLLPMGSHCAGSTGLGPGVGRGLGVGPMRGVGVGLGVAVAVGVGVAVAVGVGVGPPVGDTRTK